MADRVRKPRKPAAVVPDASETAAQAPSPATSREPAKGSPLWEQYQAQKRQHPDTILFFRLGDFYETFGDDAKLVARELQITLTSRPMTAGVRVPMAGVPHHSVDNYLARLLARGYKVVMAEQLDGARQSEAPSERLPARAAEPPAIPGEPPPTAPSPDIMPTQLSLPL